MDIQYRNQQNRDLAQACFDAISDNEGCTLVHLETILGINRTKVYRLLQPMLVSKQVLNFSRNGAFSIYYTRVAILSMLEINDETVTLHTTTPDEILDEPPAASETELKWETRRAKNSKRAETFSAHHLAPFMTVNSDVGWNRIIALKRMRTRLIEDWHPLIDLVLKDYETIMHAGDE